MDTGSAVVVLLIVAWETLVAFGAWQTARAPARIAAWPTAPGRCIDFRRLQSVQGQEKGTERGWHAAYEYEVDGQSHQALVRAHRPDAPIKRHWPGREAPISVDPRHPHEPTLAVVGPMDAETARRKAIGIALAGQIAPAFILAIVVAG